ncbi:hypothetical protein FB567DRAFT_568684 [Paraphoma chrysanthemicola]|uniref:Uncharacterized protein n=1 Tax=Paraphoma chrysanthemicola TaxID=798071 RepID=A0A8K0RCZ1_9PLEO|nr:hypothetical protein FB567DRAFT_568684 [Paraphoma chrysanthemicola]
MTSSTHQTHELQGSRPTSPVQPTDTASTTTNLLKKEQPYSSDPFAPNYRHFFPSEQQKAEWEIFESVEHAEYSRTKDQLDVLLRERRLYEHFYEILYSTLESAGDDKTEALEPQTRDRVVEAREYLQTAGDSEPLLWRAEEIWRLNKWRQPVNRGDVKVEKLLEVGDVIGYNWIRMMQGVHDWVKYREGVVTAEEDTRKE